MTFVFCEYNEVGVSIFPIRFFAVYTAHDTIQSKLEQKMSREKFSTLRNICKNNDKSAIVVVSLMMDRSTRITQS